MQKERRCKQMKPDEWMIQYTPQTEWVERRGILIWLSLYAGIFGGGSYLVYLSVHNLWGMFISWLIIAVLKSGLHVVHAERPLKLWRMILRPRTSWISRGLIITILLIGFGALQLAFSFWLPGTAGEMVFKVLTGIMAFGIILYAGFTLSYVNGIPFWNSALLPVLFIVWGILGGLALVMAIGLGVDGVDIGAVIALDLGLLIAAIILIVLYLWTATYAEPTAKRSVRELTQGLPALVLGIGVILCGIIIPLAILLSSYLNGIMPAPSLAILILACEIVGGLAFTYSVLKVGLYSPLILA
jgi:formate-dependent nitrite reductase membrane component NrfD